jgi:hypothetical protein
MMLKNKLFLIGLVALIFTFQSCKKSGSLTIQFKPKVNGQNLVLNQTYKNSDANNFEIERLKFYISDLTITVAGRSVLLSEIALLDASKPASMELNFDDFDNVTITQIGFGLGVKPSFNNPSKSIDYDLGQFAAAHPLSASQNMFWGMTNDYRFFMLEGKSDTSVAQNATLNPSKFRSFLYHIGKDKFYTMISLDNKAFNLEQGKDNALVISIDIDKVFTNGTDTIHMGTEYYTEAMSPTQEALAQRFINNLKNAFTIE